MKAKIELSTTLKRAMEEYLCAKEKAGNRIAAAEDLIDPCDRPYFNLAVILAERFVEAAGGYDE